MAVGNIRIDDLISWEDAFQFPVQSVRKAELQLQHQINDRSERLRSKVGANYRELLGNAEQIVNIHDDLQRVDGLFSSISQQCSSRVIERKQLNTQRFQRDLLRRNEKVHRTTALIGILQASSQSIKTLLAPSKSNLLPAKILILSRLVYKVLAESPIRPPYVDTIRDGLASLRSVLLDRIEYTLSTMAVDEDLITDNLVAYCIATSSTASNALQYFLRTRLDAIMSLLSDTDTLASVKESILHSLNLFFNTLQHAKTVFRSKLIAFLLKLRSKPLLQDSAIQARRDLNLKLDEVWLSPEIRNFILYIRHDDLNRIDLERQMREWTNDALQQIIGKVAAKLEREKDFGSIVDIRVEIFSIWLNNKRLIPGEYVDRLEELRSLLRNRLVKLIQRKVKKLISVYKLMMITKESSLPEMGITSTPYWPSISALASSDMESQQVKNQIISKSFGRSTKNIEVTSHYTRWAKSMSTMIASVEKMKSHRFSDYIDDLDDSPEFEDFISQLKKEDPEKLVQVIDTSLSRCKEEIREKIRQVTDNVEKNKNAVSVKKAIYLLRTMRDLSKGQKLLSTKNSSLSVVNESNPFLEIFCKMSMTQTLHMLVIDEVLAEGSEVLAQIFKPMEKPYPVPGRCLWEGDPQLPVQPMPNTYAFLQKISTSMTSYGFDIWSSSATAFLKKEIFLRIRSEFSLHINSINNDESVTAKEIISNGRNTVDNKKTDSAEDKKVKFARNDDIATIQSEWLTQLAFDSMYLKNILGLQVNISEWQKLINAITSKANIEHVQRNKLGKSADEYYKRTCIYFGLLASK